MSIIFSAAFPLPLRYGTATMALEVGWKVHGIGREDTQDGTRVHD
jgi:hypothetical protein